MITMRSQTSRMLYASKQRRSKGSQKPGLVRSACISIGPLLIAPLLTQCGTSIKTGRNGSPALQNPTVEMEGLGEGKEKLDGSPVDVVEEKTTTTEASADSMVNSEGRVLCTGSSATASAIYSSFCKSPETEAQRANFGDIITRFCDNGEYQNLLHPSCAISNAQESAELSKPIHVISKTPEDSKADSFEFLGVYSVNLPPARDPFEGFNEMFLLAHGNPGEFVKKNFKFPNGTQISVAPPLTPEQINVKALREQSLKFTYNIAVAFEKLSLSFNSKMTAELNQSPMRGGREGQTGNVFAYFDEADVKDLARLNAKRSLTVAVVLPNGSTTVTNFEQLDIPDGGVHKSVQKVLQSYFKMRINFLVDNAGYYAGRE